MVWGRKPRVVFALVAIEYSQTSWICLHPTLWTAVQENLHFRTPLKGRHLVNSESFFIPNCICITMTCVHVHTCLIRIPPYTGQICAHMGIRIWEVLCDVMSFNSILSCSCWRRQAEWPYNWARSEAKVRRVRAKSLWRLHQFVDWLCILRSEISSLLLQFPWSKCMYFAMYWSAFTILGLSVQVSHLFLAFWLGVVRFMYKRANDSDCTHC